MMTSSSTSAVLWAATALFGVILLAFVVRKSGDEFVQNERVKLFATALNNLGVAAFIYGLIAPKLNGTGAGSTALGFALGAIFVAAAQLVLRGLRPPPKS